MSEPLELAQSFESLRAEAETPWLDQVFLPPREFNLMTGPHSILVMGGEGSGRTALEIQLKAWAAQKESPRLLTASWRLQLSGGLASNEQVAELLAQGMNSIAFSFLQTLVRAPSFFSSAPSWARDFAHWFVWQYLQGDREFHLSRLAAQAVPDGLEIAARLISESPRPLFPQHTPAFILPHLTEAIKALGFEGIWIFLDGLDALFHTAPDQLEQFLTYFLSTLEYFENPAFAFKIITSHNLGLRLQKARGVITRRFKSCHLKWQEEELFSLAEKRLMFALKRETMTLAELCQDRAWIKWLKRYAGDTPRGWLDLTRPILVAYLKKGQSLSDSEWLDVYRQSAPPLRLDTETSRVFMGYGKLDVPAVGYKLLAYLYENRHRSCTKSELYYRAYKDLDKEPRTKDDTGWDNITEWEGMLDTALWRLRQALEWDSRKGAAPLYVISERGRGQIHLGNTS